MKNLCNFGHLRLAGMHVSLCCEEATKKITFHYISVPPVKCTIVPVQRNIFKAEKKSQNGCRQKTTGILSVYNELGSSILLTALTALTTHAIPCISRNLSLIG